MNKLSKLCQDQGWNKEDVAEMLGLSVPVVYRMMLENNIKTILPNDFKLLRYIAGEL